jgi:RNA polymerase sigma-70 factor (ECF subfamily)
MAHRITRNREDAEDVVQQSFQKAFINLQKFEGDSLFSAWLTRIAINEARMLLRRKRGSQSATTVQPLWQALGATGSFFSKIATLIR